jgi:hypothetical protein
MFRCSVGFNRYYVQLTIGFSASSRLTITRNCEFVMVPDSRQISASSIYNVSYILSLLTLCTLQYYVFTPNLILEYYCNYKTMSTSTRYFSIVKQRQQTRCQFLQPDHIWIYSPILKYGICSSNHLHFGVIFTVLKAVSLLKLFLDWYRLSYS